MRPYGSQVGSLERQVVIHDVENEFTLRTDVLGAADNRAGAILNVGKWKHGE